MNGKRNINEFSFGGDVKDEISARSGSDEIWTEYLFYPYNGSDLAIEWWLHVPSGYWFIAKRHRVNDEIFETFSPEEYFSLNGKNSNIVENKTSEVMDEKRLNT